MHRINPFVVALMVITALGSGTDQLTAQAVVIRPGDSHLTTAHLVDQVTKFQMCRRSATGDTTEKAMPGTLREQQVVQGADLLLIKSTEVNGRGVLDSMVVRRAGLTPSWERLYVGGRRTDFTFSGKRVQAVAMQGDSVLRTFDSTFTVPVFGATQLDIVIRSLPLRLGYQAILPLFSEGSFELEMDTVAVTGEDRRAAGGAQWIIRFADPAIVTTYGISQKTRVIVRYEVVQRKTGDRFRQVPK